MSKTGKMASGDTLDGVVMRWLGCCSFLHNDPHERGCGYMQNARL